MAVQGLSRFYSKNSEQIMLTCRRFSYSQTATSRERIKGVIFIIPVNFFLPPLTLLDSYAQKPPLQLLMGAKSSKRRNKRYKTNVYH